MGEITGTQVKLVIDSYKTNNSILETSKETGLSTVKVRKILITEGLWESDTSRKIGELLDGGMTTEEIASTLYMSVKNVQAYTPYERGVYGGEEPSKEAIRSDKYRNRMKTAATRQVIKSNGRGKNMDITADGRSDMQEGKIVEFKKKEDKNRVLKLHLELNMEYVDEEEMRILKKYGGVKNALSRDILVPSEITLHALNYAILRMFGWQNGHLHNFALPENVFKELTEDKYLTWSKLAGVYFRFPTENYEDIYWDDNYKEGESFKTWLKRKYTGPYKYKGYGEHYIMNQIEVDDMFARWNEITVREFDFRAKVQPQPYNVKLREATIYQVMHAFVDMNCCELIERLPLSDVLYIKSSEEANYEKIRKYVESKVTKLKTVDATHKYQRATFKSNKQDREYLERYNIPVKPVTDQLIYRYDYGDGWEVLITCEDIYECDDMGVWTGKNSPVEDILIDYLEEILEKHRPICIKKDGIELVDDVGGIGGFCEMLKTIYEADDSSPEAILEKEEMLGWASMMGWTGRRISPRQTL